MNQPTFREVERRRCRRARPRRVSRHRRARDRRVGCRPHRGGRPRPAGRGPATHRRGRARHRRAAAALLRRRRPFGACGRVPGALGVHRRRQHEGDDRRLATRGRWLGRAVELPAHRGAAASLRAAGPHPGDRPGGPAQAHRRSRAPHRRGWPRIADRAVPRRIGRGDHRHRRRRRGRGVEPPAPGAPRGRSARHAQGRLGRADDSWRSTRRRRWSSTSSGSAPTTSTASSTGYDVIVDGTDNFETRYALNDAAVRQRKPVVHGSIYRWDGQVTTFVPFEGPCYRCMYPTQPPPELAPACSVAGVLGVLPGMVGMLQANEVFKLVLGVGETLSGRLLMLDAAGTTFDEVRIWRDPACPACGDRSRCVPGRSRSPSPPPDDHRSHPARPARQHRRQPDRRGRRRDRLRGARRPVRPAPRPVGEDRPGRHAVRVHQRLPERPRRPLPRRAGHLGHRAATRSSSCPPWPEAPGRSGDRAGPARGARGLLDAIGATPMVELTRLAPSPDVRIFAKLEGANPTGQRQGPRGAGDDPRGRGGGPAAAGPHHPRAVEREHRHQPRAHRPAAWLSRCGS